MNVTRLRTFVSRWLRYAWPLRVPVVSALLLAGLPLIAFYTSLRPFLSGLFDPVGAWAMAPIVALALFNAWTIILIAWLILCYGHDRFDLPETSFRFPPSPAAWLVGTLLLSTPVIVVTATYTAIPAVGPGLAGAGVALLLAGLAALIARRVRKANRLNSTVWRDFVDTIASFPLASSGFIEIDEVEVDGRKQLRRVVAPGHGLAFGLAAGAVILYVAIGYGTRNVQRPLFASALGYVLLLILVLTWIVGAVAFIFDRIRLPLVLLFLSWVLIVTFVIDRVAPSDHVYQTFTSMEPVPAEDVAHLLRYTASPILVAVSGGGIEAAAWAAHALSEFDHIDGFRENVRLISAVSGGSVATMNMLAGWTACGSELPEGAFDADAASRESSLHAVGWGLVFADLPRTVAPFAVRQARDRGSVLEDAWKRESRLKASTSTAYLASWRTHVSAHLCPGVVFNSMVAETGEPMLFSTVKLPSELRAFSFNEHYPGRDVSISTAVRLSATFPYVSPAARADRDSETGFFHLVDGGYFDNYGVGTLAATANAALSALPPLQRRRLLVIEICDAAECSGQAPPGEPSTGGTRRAWPYQILAPLSALVAERSEAQRVTDRTTLNLLAQSWRSDSTCIEIVHVPLGHDNAPMSWHLTNAEKRQVDAAWNRLNQSTHVLDKVRGYLAGEPSLATAACMAVT